METHRAQRFVLATTLASCRKASACSRSYRVPPPQRRSWRPTRTRATCCARSASHCGDRPEAVHRHPAYDATQHLFNSPRADEEPLHTIRRRADLLKVDAERVRLWTFARAAAEPRHDWDDDPAVLARVPEL